MTTRPVDSAMRSSRHGSTTSPIVVGDLCNRLNHIITTDRSALLDCIKPLDFEDVEIDPRAHDPHSAT